LYYAHLAVDTIEMLWHCQETLDALEGEVSTGSKGCAKMDAAQSILRRKMISSTAHKRNKISL
jgi:hypothetical protein